TAAPARAGCSPSAVRTRSATVRPGPPSTPGVGHPDALRGSRTAATLRPYGAIRAPAGPPRATPGPWRGGAPGGRVRRAPARAARTPARPAWPGARRGVAARHRWGGQEHAGGAAPAPPGRGRVVAGL